MTTEEIASEFRKYIVGLQVTVTSIGGWTHVRATDGEHSSVVHFTTSSWDSKYAFQEAEELVREYAVLKYLREPSS